MDITTVKLQDDLVKRCILFFHLLTKQQKSNLLQLFQEHKLQWAIMGGVPCRQPQNHWLLILGTATCTCLAQPTTARGIRVQLVKYRAQFAKQHTQFLIILSSWEIFYFIIISYICTIKKCHTLNCESEPRSIWLLFFNIFVIQHYTCTWYFVVSLTSWYSYIMKTANQVCIMSSSKLISSDKQHFFLSLHKP